MENVFEIRISIDMVNTIYRDLKMSKHQEVLIFNYSSSAKISFETVSETPK